MSAKAVRNAKKKERELLQALEDVRKFLSLYEEFSGFPKENTKESPSESGSISSLSAKPVENFQAATPSQIAAAAKQLILNAGKPLTRSELAFALTRAGVILNATDESKYVGTIMWRHKNSFEQIEGEGYWPIGEPRPTESRNGLPTAVPSQGMPRG